MPNIVYNKLKFTCHGEVKADKIKAFFEHQDLVLSFQKLIPVPPGISDPNPCVLSQEEHKWCIDNWGTKWDAMNAEITHEDDWKIGYTFETAWNIPKPIIELIFKEFSDCNINYLAADDGGWIAYHQSIGDDRIIEINDFSENPKMKQALFEALNTSY